MKEYKIDEVCDKMLDNAYYTFDIKKIPHLEITFYVMGKVFDKYWKVIFDCNSITDFSIKNYDFNSSFNERAHDVIYTSVNKLPLNKVLKTEPNFSFFNKGKEGKYKVILNGGIDINIECIDFNWKLIELKEKDYNELFFNEE